jgi:hypothetical protein
MHATLKLKTNLLQVICCSILTTVFFVLAHPRPLLVTIVAGVTGILAGFLQQKSLISSAERFLTAQTAMEVRKALMDTRSGKLSIMLQWIAIGVVVAISIHQNLNVSSVRGICASYFFFMLMRDLVALRGVFYLKKQEQLRY